MKIVKKIGKILVWILLGVIGFLLLIAIAIQTRPVKNVISKTAVEIVNNTLNAELDVNRLDGNFFDGIGLENVFMKHANDTVGFIPSLKLKYNLLPLLRGNIVVNSVEIDKPVFYLIQDTDSTWNFLNIVKANPDTTAGKPFSMSINIQHIEINDGTIFVNALDTVFPSKVNHLFTDVSFRMKRQDVEVDLKKLGFNAKKPDLTVKNISGNFQKDADFIRLKDFVIHTEKNKILAGGEYNSKNMNNSFVDLQTAPLHTEELQFLIPDIKIPANPNIKLKANIKANGATIDVNLKDNNQLIDMKVISPNLVGFIYQKEKLKYDIQGNFENIDLNDWLDSPSLNYKLTGNLVAKGEGIDPKTLKAAVKGAFKNLSLLERQVDKLDFHLNYKAGNVQGVVDGIGNFGQLHLVPNVNDLFGKSPNYRVGIITKQLDLAQLLLNPELKSNINLNGMVIGNGFNPKTMTASAKGVFNGISVYNYQADNLNFDLGYRYGNVNGNLDANGDFGKLYIEPNVRDILAENPEYTAHVTTTGLNLAPIIKNDSLASNLNLEFEIKGKGFDTKQLTADAALVAHPSSIMGVEIRKLLADVRFANQNLSIDTLLLNTKTVLLHAEGNYSLIEKTDLSVEAEMKNGSEIASFLQMDSVETSGWLKANLKGKTDSMRATLEVNLDSTRFKEYSLGALKGNAIGLLTKTDTLINADLKATNLVAVGMNFSSVDILAKSNIYSTDLELNADGELIKANVVGNLKVENGLFVTLDDVLFDYKDSDWKLIDAPATVKIDKENYELNNLMLVSGTQSNSDSLQIISANGVVSRTNEQNLDLKLFNINIPAILALFDLTQPVEGNLDLNLYLRGTAANTLLEGGFNVSKAAFSDYKITDMGGTINYDDGKLSMNVGIVPQDSGLLELSGYIPFAMHLDSMQFEPPSPDAPIGLKVLADRIPLKIINAFYPMDEIDGYVTGDISVEGTIKSPNPIGKLQIIDGKAKLKQYGIDYKEILASVDFQPETVTVDTVYIRSKDGSMFANGGIGFNSVFYRGDVQQSDIDIKFRNFHPVNHRFYNMELSGDVSLHGKKDSVYFNGDLTILEALAYLPALRNLVGGSSPPEVGKPILISELERTNQYPDSVIINFKPKATEEENKVEFNYLDNVRGNFKVYIPRNTWIKNDQFRLELSGDVEVIKNRNSLEVFGPVDVIRGQYQLLGKTFVVDEGTLNFQGGEELNPLMDIVAHYTFRNQSRTDQKLEIRITGELQEMEIAFNVDGEKINEGDALSYILFGTNMDALGSGQQATLNSNTAGEFATSAAASILSSELSKFVGNAINVDYIELKAGGAFENATLVVGKYITNKLFMSYERRFGDFKDANVSEYEVKLEYELFRFLFLQLVSSTINNGADLILKFDTNTNFKEQFRF